MKLLLTITCLIALGLSAANAQTSSTTTTSTDTARAQGPDATTTTTTSTTENVGTVSDFTPGSTLVLSSGTGEPAHYKLAKNVTYVNAKGKVITADRIR